MRPAPPLIGVMDCNNFYASCERVFRPNLIRRPVVVLSNNDGCIISRSNEAKALGIKMGAPYHMVRPLLEQHRVAVFSANFSLYGDLSGRVMTLLKDAVPQIEVYSIDEAFLGFAPPPEGVVKVGRTTANHVTECCHDLRYQVARQIGLPVSFGVGSTKTLAKLAVEHAKHPHSDGVSVWTDPDDIDRILRATPVGQIWGVGFRLAPKLERLGIRTAWDLQQADDHWILKTFNKVLLQTVLELRGIPCLPLTSADADPRQTILCSRSFGSPVGTLALMQEAVATYTSRAAEKLRQDGLMAQHVRVFIRTNRFQPWRPQLARDASRHLVSPTESTVTLIQAAKEALSGIYQPGLVYHKAGVLLSHLTPKASRQLPLWGTPMLERSDRLMPVWDQINHDWGQATLRSAAEGVQKRWKMRQSQRSQRFTTHWEELLEVN